MLWIMNLLTHGPWTTKLYFSVLVLSCSLSVGLLLGTGIARLMANSPAFVPPTLSSGDRFENTTIPSWRSEPSMNGSEIKPATKKDDYAITKSD